MRSEETSSGSAQRVWLKMPDDPLPPDPWEEDGIDLWALEQAEELARKSTTPDDPRWERVDGPLIDDFDEADRQPESPSSLPGPAVVVGGAVFVLMAYVVYTALR